jgi:hypothetical protein
LCFLRRRFFLLFFVKRRFLRFRFLLFFWFGFLFFLFLFRWSLFSFFSNERNLVADIYLTAFFDINFSECSVLRRFPFHRRLVGFNFGEHVAG